MFLYYPRLIIVNLFIKYIPIRVAEKYYTMKKLTSKLQRTGNLVFLFYRFLIVANLLTKHTPTRVTENYYTMKKLASKLQHRFNCVIFDIILI